MDIYIGANTPTTQTTTPEQVDKKKFMNKSTANKFSELYDEIEELKRIVADLTERLDALEAQETPEPTTEPEPTPEPTEPIIYTFESFGDAEGNTYYGTGKVQVLEDTMTINEEEYKKVKVIENTVEGWVNEEFYISSNGEADQLHQLVNTNGEFIPVWVRYSKYTGEAEEDLPQENLQS